MKEVLIQFINFEQNDKEIYEIDQLCNLKITTKLQNKGNGPMRAMLYMWHIKNTCFRSPHCVKCGENHFPAAVLSTSCWKEIF